jgi:hypothetical protein
MHLVLLVFKSNWRPGKESCMVLKLAMTWRGQRGDMEETERRHRGDRA